MKRLKCAVLALALILAAAFVPSFSSDASAVKGKWVKTSKGTRYKKANGKYVKNQYIDGRYIDKKGYWTYKPKYSWGTNKNGKFYKDTKKKAIKDRVVKIDGSWYSFDKKGYIRTKQFYKGSYYNKNGVKNGIKGAWVTTKNGKRYQIIVKGKKTRFAKGGWYRIGDRDYYFTADGYLQTWRVLQIGKQIFGFDSNGHQKNYTILSTSETKTVEGEIRFTVTAANKHDAAVDMDKFLGLVMEDGTKKAMSIDGVEKTISNKGGTIYVGNKTLVDYVDGAKAGTVIVKSSGKMSAFLNAFDAAKLGAKASSYKYTVKIGSVTFSDFAMKSDYMSFKAGGKSYQGLYTGDKLYVLGDASSAGFVTELKSAGVISAVKVAKNTTKY